MTPTPTRQPPASRQHGPAARYRQLAAALRHALARAASARALLVLGAALLPALSWPALSRRAAAAIGSGLALRVAAAANRLEGWLHRPPPQPLPPTRQGQAIAKLSGDLPFAPAAASSMAGTATSAHPHPALGISIGRERVRAAARAGIRPSGDAVPATSERPAGLALRGVAALGVGLRDGDVLTRVGGTPARSVATVIAAARGALRSGATSISGEVRRGRLRLLVTVELPDLRAEASGGGYP